jgi:hypothetical protein
LLNEKAPTAFVKVLWPPSVTKMPLELLGAPAIAPVTLNTEPVNVEETKLSPVTSPVAVLTVTGTEDGLKVKPNELGVTT